MYQFFAELFSPFTLLCLGLLFAVANLWRKRVESKRRLLLVTVPLCVLLFLCTPVASFWSTGLLEWRYALLEEVPEDADAIVVLGGGIRPPTPTLPEAELAENTRFRCIYAAELYKQRPIKIVVTGGIVDDSIPVPPLAPEMKELLMSLGVSEDDILVEDQSKSTYENAALSKPILDENEIQSIVLITDAKHLMRSKSCFTAQGFDVTPAPCRRSSDEFRWRPQSFLPRAASARSVQRAMHEWVGMVWYTITGKM